MYKVYLLKSLKNGKSYVGMTTKDVEVRLVEHNEGSNTWTRNNRPFELKYFENYVCQEDAMKREKFFKTGQGKKLRKIILQYF